MTVPARATLPLESDRPMASGWIFIGILLLIAARFLVGSAAVFLSLRGGHHAPVGTFYGFLAGFACVLGVTAIWGGALQLSRRCKVPRRAAELPEWLQPLKRLRWRRRRGRYPSPHAADLAAAGLRVVLDDRLARELEAVEVPGGLVEPTRIHATPATTLLMAVISSVMFLPIGILMFGLLLLQFGRMSGGAVVVTVIGIVVLGLVLSPLARWAPVRRRLLALPLPPRLLGRGQRATVGPGWIRVGPTVWHVGQAVLIVRRYQGAAVSTAVQAMVCGVAGTLTLEFAGTPDPMLHALWRGWMCPDPRPEFAAGDLSDATL